MQKLVFSAISLYMLFGYAALSDSKANTKISAPSNHNQLQQILENEMRQEFYELDDAASLQEDIKASEAREQNIRQEILGELENLQAQADNKSSNIVDPEGADPEESVYDKNFEETELPSIDPDAAHLKMLNEADDEEETDY